MAAQERLVFLDGIPLLEVSEDVDQLAAALLKDVPLPAKAAIDAFHISVAAVNWCRISRNVELKHIANPSLRPRIEVVCRDWGYEPPVICTPQELLEIDDAP